MNKNEFLKKLESKLMVLETGERKDIIDEYDVIITEKINHGKTEEEAIKDFGNIDILVKEILSAYKINPEYKNEKDKDKEEFDNFIKEADSLIKKAAKYVTSLYNNLVDNFRKSNGNISVEGVFEIIIKSTISLFILAFIFQFVRWVAVLIIQMIFIDFRIISRIVSVLINFSSMLLYIGIAILVVNKIIKKVAFNQPKEEKKTIKNTKEEVKVKEPKVDKQNDLLDSLTSLFFSIFKVLIIIWTLPFVGLSIFTYFALILILYLVTKGLLLAGPIILLVGGCILTSYLLKVVYSIIDGKKNIKFYPLVLSLIFIALGSIMTFDYAASLNYLKDVPRDKYVITKEIIKESINDNINLDSNLYDDVKVDETLNDGELVFELNYYKDFIKNVTITKYTGYLDENNNDQTNIHLSTEINKPIYKMSNVLITSLKNKEVFPIKELYEVDVKVYVNQNTYNKINNFN